VISRRGHRGHGARLQRDLKAYEGFASADLVLRPRGYIAGLVGPNGAGKTTLMRVALGLAAVDDGSVRVFGEDPRQAGPRSARESASSTKRHRSTATCRSSASQPLWLRSTRRGTRRVWPAHRRVRYRPAPRSALLSRGTRTKLALARALSHRAELLLLDEPTTGLDPVFRDDLLGRLSALIGDGRTAVLFSTQIVSDLERIADFIVLIRDGRLLFSGPQDDVLDHWAVVRAGPDLSAELTALSPRGLAATRQGVEALVEDIDAARRSFGGRALVEKATLEDVFLLCRELPRSES
jgi:ABC-2 type transport system ATP-binding protein